MNKENIKTKLFEMQQNIINELVEKIEVTHSMVDLDEGNTLDPDDYSHQFETGELEQLMKVQLNKAKGNFEKLQTIDFSPKKAICPGAYVETNKFNFFVGFSTVPFDVDGKHIIGISAGSPIYSIMVNKKQGDSFSFCGVDYIITKIN